LQQFTIKENNDYKTLKQKAVKSQFCGSKAISWSQQYVNNITHHAKKLKWG
jgi:hypothetical protein